MPAWLASFLLVTVAASLAAAVRATATWTGDVAPAVRVHSTYTLRVHSGVYTCAFHFTPCVHSLQRSFWKGGPPNLWHQTHKAIEPKASTNGEKTQNDQGENSLNCLGAAPKKEAWKK